MSIIEKKQKVVSQNGVTMVKNVYVDGVREYNKSTGSKKKAILDTYTYATQINEMRKVLIALAEKNAIDCEVLKEIDNFINS